ncbi:GT2 family glycosyltransferase [Phycicoccus badiiscoriae]|uniref:GT2 family glycosyltransferase n=1 Tax=Pedococcus badiiscoriae TaxID=642776 RepID=A0A852WLL5_9MICO|nr:glycosyltransferase [Pedococcus badiiscoriae]NYG07674.1 GT2 family glycosyltransferase [Pedococcus badiiscoriae]
MTLAPAHEVTDPAGSPAAVATVTAVLVLRGPTSALPETLDSLARQTRSPDRLVVVDPGRDERDGNAVELVRAHHGLAEAIASISFVTVPDAPSLAYAVRAALAQSAPGDADASTDRAGDAGSAVTHVWVLTCDSAAAPMTLARLLDAVRRSPSVGAAGPKLLEWSVPGALRSVGLQLTRSGRVIPSPAPGEPDQGQYDRRTDVLAVPATGMLVERQMLDELGRPERAFGDFGADVDFSWRAQQSGRRVVVVPRATLRTGAPAEPDEVVPGDSAARVRRQARRVAMARCAWWSLPLLAAWIVASSTAAAVALLLAKRPRAAWAELCDIGAVLTPGRVLGARWRSRGTRRVRRRDLRGLFVRSTTVLRHTTDLIHDEVALEPGQVDATRGDTAESGPVADEAQDLNVLGATWASHAARNPGLLATLAMTLVAALSSRHLGGTFADRLDNGVAGGETVGVRADSVATWHAWLDGWHGPGLGAAGEQGPHLVVLSALSWLVAHVPLVGPPASPVGAVVTLLVTFALPLATLAAYLGARVVTHSRWPRALAALAWSTSAVLATAVGSGRLGGIVAAILLPLVAAGVALAARRTGTATVTAATVLAASVLGAFAPALLVLVVLAGLVVTVVARGARVRGLAIALGPVLLLGSWVPALVERPALLFTGPGLSVWGTAQGQPWQLALLHPGGPGSYPVLLSAPLVLAGLLGLLRAGRRGRAATVLAIVALLGLAYAVAAPRIQLGVVPQGLPGAGRPVTAWAGVGLLVVTLALVASALVGAEGLAVSRARGGWQALARWPVAAAVLGAVLVSAGWLAVRTVGDELRAWQDPRPAVAIDQAESGLGNRMLLLQPEGDGLTYELLGREVGDVARTLPSVPADHPSAAALAASVGALFQQGAIPGTLAPARDLADQAVGFIGLRADATDPRIRSLDATAGLSRLGEHDGVLFWRVLAGGGATADHAVAPSRARIVTGTSQQAIPVSGPHAQLDVKAVVPQGASLVLAEPSQWVRHARVTVDGTVVAPRGDTAAYPLPAGTATISVDVLPTNASWRYAQGGLLLLVAFLALPFGNRSSRRRRP